MAKLTLEDLRKMREEKQKAMESIKNKLVAQGNSAWLISVLNRARLTVCLNLLTKRLAVQFQSSLFLQLKRV